MIIFRRLPQGFVIVNPDFDLGNILLVLVKDKIEVNRDTQNLLHKLRII